MYSIGVKRERSLVTCGTFYTDQRLSEPSTIGLDHATADWIRSCQSSLATMTTSGLHSEVGLGMLITSGAAFNPDSTPLSDVPPDLVRQACTILGSGAVQPWLILHHWSTFREHRWLMYVFNVAQMANVYLQGVPGNVCF